MEFIEQGRLQLVLPAYRVRSQQEQPSQIYVLYPHREYLPVRVRLFLEFLVEQFSTPAVNASMTRAL